MTSTNLTFSRRPPKLVLVEKSETKPVAPYGGSSEGPRPHPPYTDGMGNVWSGKGRRPGWLHQALENGAALEDLMPKAVKPRQAKRRVHSREQVAPYADDVGNTWSGKGRRPNWLVEALASGIPLERFSTAKPVQMKPVLAAKPKRRKAEPKAPYEDANGNTWSGRGRRPNWLNDAIEAGAWLENFSTK
jgi:DNA-binding protein H-NS